MVDTDFNNQLEKAKSKWSIILNIKGRKTGIQRPKRMWFIFVENRLFIRTSHRTQWSKNLRINPKITVDLGNINFEAKANEVNEKILLQKLHKEYRRRYHVFNIVSKLFMLRGDTIFFELQYI